MIKDQFKRWYEISNVYVPTNSTSKYINQKLTRAKWRNIKDTMIAGDFNTFRSVEICRSVNQLDLINVYRTQERQNVKKKKIDHTLGRTVSLNTLQNINTLQVFIQFKFNINPWQKESQYTRNSLTKMKLN